MRRHYEEDEETLRVRLLLDKGPKMMASYKEGDYIMMGDGGDIGENSEISPYQIIDLEDVMNKKRYQDIGYVDFDDEEEIFFINRLYKVIEVGEGGIPLVQAVQFPGERKSNFWPESLLSLLDNFIYRHCEYYGRNHGLSVINKVIDNFVKLDDDYADSILLESQYIPYANALVRLKDFEATLEPKIKKRKKEIAAINRRTRARERQQIKEEFEWELNKVLMKKYKE